MSLIYFRAVLLIFQLLIYNESDDDTQSNLFVLKSMRKTLKSFQLLRERESLTHGHHSAEKYIYIASGPGERRRV